MDLLIDILLDAGKDTLALVPFLLVTYLFKIMRISKNIEG